MNTLRTSLALLLLPALTRAGDLEDGINAAKKNDFDSAIAALSRHLVKHPEDARGLYWRGYSYRGKMEYARAIADLEKVTELDPWPARAYLQLGIISRLQGDDGRAIGCFTMAIAFELNLVEALVNRSVLFTRSGWNDEAIKDASNALRFDNKNAEAYASRARPSQQEGVRRRY